MKSYIARGTKSVGGLLSLAAAVGLLALMTPQAGADVLYNGVVPLAPSVYNPCAGENVDLIGVGHEVIRETINGNTYHFGIHVNLGDVTGLGETSGAQYKVGDSFVFQFNLSAGETYTQAEEYHLIGQGQTPNLVVHSLFHFTANANGVLTSSVDIVSVDCH